MNGSGRELTGRSWRSFLILVSLSVLVLGLLAAPAWSEDRPCLVDPSSAQCNECRLTYQQAGLNADVECGSRDGLNCGFAPGSCPSDLTQYEDCLAFMRGSASRDALDQLRRELSAIGGRNRDFACGPSGFARIRAKFDELSQDLEELRTIDFEGWRSCLDEAERSAAAPLQAWLDGDIDVDRELGPTGFVSRNALQRQERASQISAEMERNLDRVIRNHEVDTLGQLISSNEAACRD